MRIGELPVGYDALLNCIPHRVFIKNTDRIYLFANEAFAAQCGHPAADIPGKSDFDLYPLHIAEANRANDLPVLQEGRSIDVVENYESGVRKSVIRTIKRPLRNRAGQIVGVFGMYWDIGAELRDRDALATSSAHLDMVLDSHQVGTWYWNSIEKTFHLDEVCARFYNLEAGRELTSPDFLELIHPEDRARLGEELDAVISSRSDTTRFEWNYRVSDPDGLVRYLHTRGDRLRNEGEDAFRITGITFDVRTRGRAEDALRTILKINRQIGEFTREEILQRGLEEAVRLTDSRIGFFHLVDEANGEIILQQWSRETMTLCSVGETERHYPIGSAGIWVDCIRQRTPVIHNDYATAAGRKGLPAGHFPLIRFLTVPIFLGEEIVAVIGVGNKPGEYDSTDADHLTLLGENIWNIISRKDHQEELARSRDEALEAEGIKDRFLSIIAHDLTGPISNIRILVEQLGGLSESEYPEPETLATINSILGRSVNNAANLLRDLLDWSRSQRNTIRFDPRPTPVRIPLDQAVQTCRDMAASKDIGITVEGPEDLEACIDSNMVQTILRNLLMNAVKFTGRGGQAGIRYRVEGDSVVFEVHDTGIGISEDRIGRLFDLGRTRSTKGTEHERGTGLGLVLCREFANRHGGEISVTSTPGEGSTFTVRLPVTGAVCTDGEDSAVSR